MQKGDTIYSRIFTHSNQVLVFAVMNVVVPPHWNDDRLERLKGLFLVNFFAFF